MKQPKHPFDTLPPAVRQSLDNTDPLLQTTTELKGLLAQAIAARCRRGADYIQGLLDAKTLLAAVTGVD